MNDPAERLEKLQYRISTACREAGREAGEVRLLAVSKTHAAERVRELAAAGQRAFGENRLEEALDKQAGLGDLGLEWHFIGPIQSRKARDIARHFDWVQSADREKVLRRLSDQRPEVAPPLDVCLQVNIDREPQKSGAPPEEVPALAHLCARLPRLRLRGVMCLPRQTDDAQALRASFAATRELYEALRAQHEGLDTLSMGMSGDLEAAIAEGSTMVRVGTALLGPRGAP